MRYIAFPKNQFFPKSNFSEKVDDCVEVPALKKSLFKTVPPKKITVPKSNYRKELSILKKWLLCRSFAPKKKLF